MSIFGFSVGVGSVLHKVGVIFGFIGIHSSKDDEVVGVEVVEYFFGFIGIQTELSLLGSFVVVVEVYFFCWILIHI